MVGHHIRGTYAAVPLKLGLLLTQPGVRPALDELSGKISTDRMRQLNSLVDVEHRPAKDVAAAFLSQLQLK